MRMMALSSDRAARRARREAGSNGDIARPLCHARLAPSRTPMHYDRMIRKSILAAGVLACLAACTSQSKVDVTSGGPVQTKSRSEPIFYNGQHYNVNYTYNSSLRLFDMKVAGTSVTMTPGVKSTATAIAT